MSNNDWKSRLNVVYSTNPDFQYEQEQAETAETLPPARQNLRVWLDRKQRAGKQVTLVKGFVGGDDDPERVGTPAQKQMRCGRYGERGRDRHSGRFP